MPDFDALLIAVSALAATAAALAARGHLTISLRRKPERKPPEPTQ